MDDRQEFHGTEVEEAVEKAATALGVPREGLRYQILDRGSMGFLGIGARDARIAVEVSVAEPDIGSSESRPEGGVEPGVNRPAEVSASATVPVSSDPPSSNYSSGEVSEVVVEADGFVTDLLERMGFDARVDAYDAGDIITVDVSLEETGLFIGQKGETIDAIQHLVNVIVYRDRPYFKRIVVDAEGYRGRRVEAIQGMAHRTARRVQREGRPLSLPPMPPSERRIVHLFLKDNPYVCTSSVGQEEDRRVTISPA